MVPVPHQYPHLFEPVLGLQFSVAVASVAEFVRFFGFTAFQTLPVFLLKWGPRGKQCLLRGIFGNPFLKQLTADS